MGWGAGGGGCGLSLPILLCYLLAINEIAVHKIKSVLPMTVSGK